MSLRVSRSRSLDVRKATVAMGAASGTARTRAQLTAAARKSRKVLAMARGKPGRFATLASALIAHSSGQRRIATTFTNIKGKRLDSRHSEPLLEPFQSSPPSQPA